MPNPLPQPNPYCNTLRYKSLHRDQSVCNVLSDNIPSARPAPSVPSAPPSTVLELRVRNHPGTMSHITGLFARRAFNLDAILCVPIDDGSTSRMLLLLSDSPRLDQVERQLARLHDVLEIRHRPDLSADAFQHLATL